jgi:hypothetical protein
VPGLTSTADLAIIEIGNANTALAAIRTAITDAIHQLDTLEKAGDDLAAAARAAQIPAPTANRAVDAITDDIATTAGYLRRAIHDGLTPAINRTRRLHDAATDAMNGRH